MSALCDYEVERERRVAENRRRMEDMGIAKVILPRCNGHNAPLWCRGAQVWQSTSIATRCRTGREGRVLLAFRSWP